MTDVVRYGETKWGFIYGPATVTRWHSDPKRGSVVIGLATLKHDGTDALEIYVTKTGRVRIRDSRGEWSPPKEPTP